MAYSSFLVTFSRFASLVPCHHHPDPDSFPFSRPLRLDGHSRFISLSHAPVRACVSAPYRSDSRSLLGLTASSQALEGYYDKFLVRTSQENFSLMLWFHDDPTAANNSKQYMDTGLCCPRKKSNNSPFISSVLAFKMLRTII